MTKTLRLVESKELEESAFVTLELYFQLNGAHWSDSLITVEWVDASVVLPDETLELCWTVSQLRRGLWEDLLRIRIVHVIGLSLASLVHLISFDKSTIQWIVLLELEVTWSGIITQHTGDCEVLRPSIEDNLSWLTCWGSHIHCSEVNGVVSTVQWHLQF